MEQRQAFFSLYIDTVTNAKFGEGVSTFKLDCLVANPSQFTDVRFVSCIHHSIDVKIEEPYLGNDGETDGDAGDDVRHGGVDIKPLNN